MSKEFQPGDIVYLISGSCPMTVETIGADGLTDLVWLDKKGRLQEAVVAAEVLTSIKPVAKDFI